MEPTGCLLPHDMQRALWGARLQGVGHLDKGGRLARLTTLVALTSFSSCMSSKT